MYLRKEKRQIREFARFISLLIAPCPAVPYGKLYMKLLEREQMTALLIHDQDFNQEMSIPSSIEKDLNWWLSTIPLVKNPIRRFSFQLEIFSDASLTGWGAHCNNKNAHGFWTQSEQKLNINRLELIAAFLALKSFAQEYKDCEILLRVDNTTAIAYINRMGGVRYPELDRLARNLWNWCVELEKRRIWIYASYIPSRESTDVMTGNQGIQISILNGS